ncbi:ABC transporter substrate-binding protein [Aliivibrio kagoshimensis]|uniref:ABC transporter substrate-binding protein n=1 Tax=Aliivibrio kagoshimensis TaxID=2910230 RepID=UPI003D0EA305
MTVRTWINTLFFAIIIGSAFSFYVKANPNKVVILTSFPESFYLPIVKEFEQKNPQLLVKVFNKNTPAVITHIQQNREPKPDIVWLSSSDAMMMLQQQQLLQKINLSSPHHFETFAWSQFGLFWHNDFLSDNQLPPPSNWNDLLKPHYQHTIALSAPSRSGTNHLMIELILQQYGWNEGWALLQQLGGNLATITARSFGVREGILKQRFGIAPVVDFFYRSALDSGHNVGFAPLPNTPLLPATVAITASTEQEMISRVFVSFLLSEQGQSLLSLPSVNRISLENKQRVESATPFHFDLALSASRYHVVNTLFDQMISHRINELGVFWREWYSIDSVLYPALKRQSKQRATQTPIAESVASDPELNRRLSPINKHHEFYQRISQQWRQISNLQLEKATQLLVDGKEPEVLNAKEK